MQTIGQIKGSLANVKGEFTEGNIAQGRPATLLRAAWLNTIQREYFALLGEDIPNPEITDQIYQRLARRLPLLRPNEVRQKETVHWGLSVCPHVLNDGGQLSIAVEQAGSIVISAGQSFIWRGTWHIHTDDYTAEQRSFTLSPNQTYHLRWKPYAGFMLGNLNNAAYNPESQTPTHILFDTSVDDMLIAEITTDSNLEINIKSLQNRQELSIVWETGPLPQNPPISEATPIASFPLDWARTPNIGINGISNFNFGLRGRMSGIFDASITYSNEHILGIDATRNGVDLILKSKQPINDGVQFHLNLKA